MKIAAVIAEYNPFHNGHLYQLNTIRETLGADYIIVVMSGNFVQKGAPSVIDKYVRCHMALACGADAVFELPVYFALGSAEYFAHGAVSLLDKLGVVDALHFGSECGDIVILQDCAKLIANETDEYKRLLNFHLKEGKSYPLARSEALKVLSEFSDVFTKPNNILAIEYLKALWNFQSTIAPFTLKRNGTEFHADILSKNSFPSATAIRKSLSENPDNALSRLNGFVPDVCLTLLRQNTFLFQNDFSQILLYRLLQNTGLSRTLENIYDITPELSNTILANTMRFSSFEDFAQLCKSKNFTYTRICRSLMHVLLDMTQSNVDLLKQNDYCQYARLLGFRSKNGKSKLLSHIHKNTSIPIITSLSKGLQQLTGSALISLKTDIHAAMVYESVKVQKMTHMSHSYRLINEMTREIIKFPI